MCLCVQSNAKDIRCYEANTGTWKKKYKNTLLFVNPQWRESVFEIIINLLPYSEYFLEQLNYKVYPKTDKGIILVDVN